MLPDAAALQLKRIIAHDPTGNGHIKELFLFVHPYLEHKGRYTDSCPGTMKVFLYYCELLQNFYVHRRDSLRFLQAYKNHPPRPIRVAKFNDSCRSTGKDWKQDAPVCTKNVDRSQEKEESPNALYARYLACQKDDWNNHKKFCGKRHFDPTALLAPAPKDPAEFIGCPATVPGCRPHDHKQGTINIPFEKIHRQFEIEYGLTITPDTIRSTEPFKEPTQQEINEQSMFILQREASVRSYYRASFIFSIGTVRVKLRGGSEGGSGVGSRINKSWEKPEMPRFAEPPLEAVLLNVLKKSKYLLSTIAAIRCDWCTGPEA
ncbi:hypothetical protein DFH07DRAFT_764449 [Mycena maculata]|uniref:Uncharacterized protein n=1 Tax=Mycena maculata TaxID=230809 RepID=A0AAD7P063_9AGAR|nr:hypothetical protein DFH07DRAFT_764449 [Mycena maculata]